MGVLGVIDGRPRCHRWASSVSSSTGAIDHACRYDHTISDIIIFQGEISKALELTQITPNGADGRPELAWSDTLEDLGIAGIPRDDADSDETEPTAQLFYDYRRVAAAGSRRRRLKPFASWMRA